MIRDRGRIKWTAMMLPEHVTLLRKWAEEDGWETRRKLDGQMLEQMDVIIQRARMTGETVIVRYYKNHHYEKVTGKIDRFDSVSKCLRVKDEHDRTYSIPIEAIDRVEGDT